MSNNINAMKMYKSFLGDKEISLIDYLDISISNLQSIYENAITREEPLHRITDIAISLKRTILEKEYYMKYQGCINGGIFKGMKYIPLARNSVLMPKLLGTYESEMSQYLISIGKDIDYFLAIGCAEGYYVAGLAYKFPNLISAGVDIDLQCINLTSILCEINNLQENTSCSSNLTVQLNKAQGDILLLIDVDGEEINILGKVLNQVKINKKVGFITIVIETDFNLNGSSNEDEIISFLLSNDFKLEQIIEQDIINRFAESTKAWSTLDRFVAGYERPSPAQKWIVAAKSQKFNGFG